MLPGMTSAVLDSTDMLKNFLPIYAKNMIDGIRANEQKLESYVQKSPILVTLLNPFIGYMKGCRDIQGIFGYKQKHKANRFREGVDD